MTFRECCQQFVMRQSCVKTDKRIEILIAVESLGDPKHIVLDGGSDPLRKGEAGRGSMWLLPNYVVSC